MTDRTTEFPEGVHSRFARMLGSAFFWSVVALPLFAWILSGLYWAHLLLDETSAATFWAPWYDVSHPLADIYDALWLLISAGLLWWWLGFRNVRAEAAPMGDRGRWAIALAVAGAMAYVVAGFMIDGVLAFFVGSGAEIYFADADALESAREMSLLTLLPGVIAAPLFEELAFRGLFLGVLLARGWNPFAAIALVAAVFASTHSQYTPTGMIFVFVAGLILGGLRVATGGLAVPMFAHALVNFMLMTPTSA